MNSYFFKMSKEERNNILDQHKELYNGFATNDVTSNMQPLYTQDFANDKGGITVSNKGDVMTYRNMNINEDIYSGSEGFEPYETFENEEEESYMVSLGEKLDMIGDGPNDLPNGTVDVDDSENETMFLIDPEMDDFDIDDFEGLNDNGGLEYDWEKDVFGDDFDDEEKGDIAFKIQESLDMFKRFKKYN